MRLDKFLADMGYGSRKEVKQLIKKGLVTVNGQVIKSDKAQVQETQDTVCFEGEPIAYQSQFYYLLNKPAGVISATVDSYEETVLDLFSEEAFREDLFPVGRLEKEYYAQVEGIMTAEDQKIFAKGIKLDGEWTLPAELQILNVDEEEMRSEIKLILHEGKFHQVKRMVRAVGKEVVYLKRIRMGGLSLPDDLALGEYRELTSEELAKLQERG